MKIKELVYSVISESDVLCKTLSFLFPHNVKLAMLLLRKKYLNDYILALYDDESLKNRKFYNVGAGDQRSKYNFWSYIDLEQSKYSKKGIDVFYDLESLKPLPLAENDAEVFFSSFVLEHISVEATKNFCKEAYRCLKKGGVFHAKVHCYDYALFLLKNNLISPKIPFENRESCKIIYDLIERNKGNVVAFFDEKKNYVIESTKNEDKIVFSPELSFLYHNATAAVDNISQKGINNVFKELSLNNAESFYQDLHKIYVDDDKKEPHQHNADYFSKEKLKQYLEDVGFSKVYFTQPFQSVSPVLWEDTLNTTHRGFLFVIEAIK